MYFSQIGVPPTRAMTINLTEVYIDRPFIRYRVSTNTSSEVYYFWLKKNAVRKKQTTENV